MSPELDRWVTDAVVLKARAAAAAADESVSMDHRLAALGVIVQVDAEVKRRGLSEQVMIRAALAGEALLAKADRSVTA